MFRRNLDITVINDEILVVFTHRNPPEAQKVARDIMGCIISEYSRSSLGRAEATEFFLKAHLARNTDLWRSAESDLQRHRSASRTILQLEAAQAKDSYRLASRQLSEAQATNMVLVRKLGPALEAIDSASLPTTPVQNKRGVLLAGLAGGMILGYGNSRRKGKVQAL